MQNQLESNKIQYLDLTHKLNEYNELFGVNSHLEKVSQNDLDRLQGAHEELRTHIAKKQQEYLLGNFSVEDLTFRTKVLRFTGILVGLYILVAVSLSSGKVSLGRTSSLIALCGTIAVIYLIILIFMAKRHSDRRKIAYNQFYWTGIDIKKQGQD